MIKISTKWKADLSGLNKLVRQINSNKVNVGWLEDKLHWTAENGSGITVPVLAASLHYWSPWADSFMFTNTRANQVWNIVGKHLNNLVLVGMDTVVKSIGTDLSQQLRNNIIGVSTPPNSEAWASFKGFNDPLIFGSALGEKPSLLGEVNWEIERR